MTTYTLENTDTGEVLDTHIITAEVARLDGAATDTRWRPGDPWTPRPATIPTHVATLLKPLTRAQLDAEPTPEAGDHVPDTDDLRKQIDLTMASYRLVLHQEAKAELWHEIASEAWAHQGATSRISEQYTDKRAALLTAYETECEAIKAGLRGRPEYGGHVYDEARGFVAADPDEPEPGRRPEGREALDRMVKRVPTVISAQRPPRDTNGDVTLADDINAIEAAGVKIHPEPKPAPEGTVRASRWARLAAWFGGATTRRRQTEQDGEGREGGRAWLRPRLLRPCAGTARSAAHGCGSSTWTTVAAANRVPSRSLCSRRASVTTKTDLLLTRAGISYRQLDWWNRKGFIHPRRAAEGYGSRRDYGPEEERVIMRMGRLVNAGIAPDAAARIARNSMIKGGYYQLLDLLKTDGEAL